ncbi:hypothetical protein JTE90_008071 [Oedothorax gibbosus]|uniref:Uncharacterized protein n=1 Tax=Oedothorax gibbosus TaxID=931172 RepID=A0AAV6UZ04_9ARAC|nr:hypothetical protein JTE90_008071 [Oedothorax gibbosus]
MVDVINNHGLLYKCSLHFSIIGLILLNLKSFVFCRPRGVAVFGGGGSGHYAEVSENWGVLSQPTKVLLYIFCAIICILLAIGIYRLVKWCIA